MAEPAAVVVLDAVGIPGFGEVGAVFLVEGPFIHDEYAAVDLFTQALLGHPLIRQCRKIEVRHDNTIALAEV